MSERDEFLTWVNTSLYAAELALHNGDPGPRRARWSGREPVSVLGAWRNAYAALGRSVSDCTSYSVELQAFDRVCGPAASGLSMVVGSRDA